MRVRPAHRDRRLDAARRAERRGAWNRPSLLPVAVAAASVGAFALAAWVLLRRRREERAA
jgi:hypothetical protein